MRDHTKLTLEQIQRWVLMRMEWAKARGVNRLDDEHKRKAEEILSEIDDTDGDAGVSWKARWIEDMQRAGVQVDAMRKERDEARHQRDEAREELRLFKIQSMFQAKVTNCDTCEWAGLCATAFPCSVCPQGAGTLQDFLRWEPQR